MQVVHSKGAEMTFLPEGETFAPLPAGFRRLLWPPEHNQLLCLLTCYVQPVAWVVLQERTFPRHDLHSNL